MIAAAAITLGHSRLVNPLSAVTRSNNRRVATPILVRLHRQKQTRCRVPASATLRAAQVASVGSAPVDFNPLQLDSLAASVEEIMTPHPVCFQQEQTVKEAARLMIEKNVSGGPVIDAQGHLCGFLSEGDLMWKGAGAPMDHFLVPPVYIGAFDLYFFLKDNQAVESELKKVLARKVSDAMTKSVVSTGPTASMSEVSTVMLKHKVNSLPVVDQGKVVGIVTRHDVLRALIASHSPLLE